MSVRRLLRIGAVAAVLGTIGLAAGAFWAWGQFTRPGPLGLDVTLVVPAGTGVDGIGAKLAEEGVIADRRLFRLGFEVWAEPKPLRAGEYTFPAGISPREVIRLLPVSYTHLTLPTIYSV